MRKKYTKNFERTRGEICEAGSIFGLTEDVTIGIFTDSPATASTKSVSCLSSEKEGLTIDFMVSLIHPRPVANPRFQACALVSHGRKNEEHTDFTKLDRINALRVMPEVTQAVEAAFSELEE